MTRVLPHIQKPSFLSVAAVLIFLSSTAGLCSAENTTTAEWNISADKITRYQNPERIIAEGDIVLEKREKLPPPTVDALRQDASAWSEILEEEAPPKEVTPDDLPDDMEPRYVTRVTIRADWVTYDIEKESIMAKGNVSIDTDEDHLLADEAQVDLKKELGSLDNAKILRQDYDLHLEGKRIEKTGVKTYRIEDGWVITCKLEEGEVPPWSFSSAETTIEQGGYAVLKHAKFNIKDVPVLYFPYMIVPVKDTRQSGFLFPELSNSSRDGFGVNLPYFLNISDSIDLTLYPEYYSERGFMPGAEFRYVLNEEDKGMFTASYLKDKLSDPSEKEYYADTGFTHTNDERYWIRGKADHVFGDNWVTRLDIDIVSDRDYLEEFSSGLTGYNESKKTYLKTFGRSFENQSEDERKNTLGILKSWNDSSLNINFLGINDVRAEETSPTPLWELPSIAYSGALPVLDSSFFFDWDADYVNFWREDGVGGHRVDIFPKMSTPIPLGSYLESSAEAGVRGIMYSVETYGDGVWTDDDNPNRFLFTFNTDVATSLVRDYTVNSDNYSYLRHSIRPYVEYSYVSDPGDDEVPIFDSVDEIDEENAITYGFDSFFDFYDNDDDFQQQSAYFRISQSYDLRSEASDDPFSAISLKLGWRPLQRMFIEYKADIPIEDDDYAVHGLEFAFTNSRGDNFGFEYRYNEEDDVEQINASLAAKILPVLKVEFEIEHSISEGETNEGSLALTYLQPCWSVKLKGEYTPTDERIAILFNLANIGTPFGVSF